MSYLSVNRVVLWVVCCLGLPVAAGAMPLSKSGSEPRTVANSAQPIPAQRAAVAPMFELLNPSRIQFADTTQNIPSQAFDVGTIEFNPRVEGSLIGMSAGTRDQENLVRDIYVSAPNLTATDEPGRFRASSPEADNRPAVVKWIYSILDAAGIVDQCGGSSCKDRVAKN